MTRDNTTYFVVGCKPWNRGIFDETISHFPGLWIYLDNLESCTDDFIQQKNPRYIFFLHWSHLVPEWITDRIECVCFHMTDVPFGRGGSPLQNLILRGYDTTKLSALRMDHGLDSGPVYMKRDLCLSGSAEEIYIRATRIAASMIREIVVREPSPVPQSGQVELFKRRKPEESEIPNLQNLDEIYDFIRMLDADGYPNAFLHYKGYRFAFRRASRQNEKVIADVVITRIGEYK